MLYLNKCVYNNRCSYLKFKNSISHVILHKIVRYKDNVIWLTRLPKPLSSSTGARLERHPWGHVFVWVGYTHSLVEFIEKHHYERRHKLAGLLFRHTQNLVHTAIEGTVEVKNVRGRQNRSSWTFVQVCSGLLMVKVCRSEDVGLLQVPVCELMIPRAHCTWLPLYKYVSLC